MISADDAKSCCAAAYGSDAVALVLGESYHPGGLSLTKQLGQRLGLRSGLRVLDVAAGPGATARLLAADFDVVVDGIDLSEPAVEKARASAAEASMESNLRFQVGDAERIPLPNSSFDAALCECAFCTFPDKVTAAREIARVLRPGGRLGITDVTVTDKGLPNELTTVAAWVSCIADAKPLEQYVRILAGAGLRTVHREPHDYAISRMIDQIVGRVRLLRMSASDQLAATGVDVDAVLRYCALAAAGGRRRAPRLRPAHCREAAPAGSGGRRAGCRRASGSIPTHMSRPIGDYALLSDCHSAALVSRDGSVDWSDGPDPSSMSVDARVSSAMSRHGPRGWPARSGSGSTPAAG